MENAAWRLAPIVSRLFELGGDESLPAASREAALECAHRMRVLLVALVDRPLTEPDPAPEEHAALVEMAVVGDALEGARRDPGRIPDALQCVEVLVAAVERLLAARSGSGSSR